MNDTGHKLLLSPVLFSHFSDSSASTKADIHCTVLYRNFVERFGETAILGFSKQILRIYSVFFYLRDKGRTDALVCFY